MIDDIPEKDMLRSMRILWNKFYKLRDACNVALVSLNRSEDNMPAIRVLEAATKEVGEAPDA